MASDNHATWHFFRFRYISLRIVYTIPTTIVIGTACKKYPKTVPEAISILNSLSIFDILYSFLLFSNSSLPLNTEKLYHALPLTLKYGFSSLEELDTAITAAFAEMHASADKLKPVENALKEKKDLRRQISIYWATKPVREGLAAQKTKKAQAAYRQEHEADLLRSEAAVRFFKANGITKFPPKKKLTAEIKALLSEKNAAYSEYQEKKRWANELLTVKRNIDQVLHGASSQGKGRDASPLPLRCLLVFIPVCATPSALYE